MSTITKTMLIGSLLVALAPAAYAAQGSTHSRHAYGTNHATSAYAQQPSGRVTIGTVRSRVDNPPGSNWQDRGINEDNGVPTR